MNALREENAALRKKLGFRQFLSSTLSSQSSQRTFTTPMETQSAEHNQQHQPVANVKKPPSYFVSGIKSISRFNYLLNEAEIVP